MDPTRTRMIMVSGPIASGKSTIARRAAVPARVAGWSVVLTDLDTVAEMALPSLADWEWAHRAHAALVGCWLRSGIDLIIDEGTCNRHEVDMILNQVPDGTEVRHVVLVADYEHSLARAQGDASRGISRDPQFLRADHHRFQLELSRLPCDLLLTVEGMGVEELSQQILTLLDGPELPGRTA